ncbi:MAG TPA: hypothetical protein VF974_08135 [Patescibacteria group bacterium]
MKDLEALEQRLDELESFRKTLKAIIDYCIVFDMKLERLGNEVNEEISEYSE